MVIYEEQIAPRHRMPRTAEIKAGDGAAVGGAGWAAACGRLCRALTSRRKANISLPCVF
jgi:hypothetical protein